MAAVVLAAGAARRMGRAKLVLPLPGGRTLVGMAVSACLDAALDPVVVVLAPDAPEVRAAVPFHPRVRIVLNARPEEGLSSSLATGLDACGEAEAALVTLADLYGQTADRTRRVLAAARNEAPLVVPVTPQGRATHPVLFGRSLWEELRALSGDVGARDVVRRHLGEAARVELPPLLDVDTEEDYRDLIEGRAVDPAAGLELP